MAIRIGVVMAAVLVLAVEVAPAEGGVRVTATPSSLRQGDAGALIVTGVPEAKLIEGSVGDRPLIFFPYADGYAALIGVDLAAPTGSATWRVGWVDGAGNPRKAVGTIKIKSRKFSVQKLSLPGNLVDLDRVTEQRADREAAQLNTLYGMSSGERLWRGHFTRPVPSTGPGEGFGARRVINGKARSPHSGLDYAAPTGTPVVAANRGRVALIGISSSADARWPSTTARDSTRSTCTSIACRWPKASSWSGATPSARWEARGAPRGRICTGAPSCGARAWTPQGCSRCP